MTYGSLKGSEGGSAKISATGIDAERLISLGERLRLARDKYSQSQFADRLGSTHQSVRRYEHGERACDALFLMNVVEKFGVDARWLLTGVLPDQAAQGVAVAPTSRPMDREEMALLLDCYLAVEGILSKNGRHATQEQKTALAIKMLDEARRLDLSPDAVSQEIVGLDSTENRA